MSLERKGGIHVAGMWSFCGVRERLLIVSRHMGRDGVLVLRHKSGNCNSMYGNRMGIY